MRIATFRATVLTSLLLLACKAKERPPSGGRAVPRDGGAAVAGRWAPTSPRLAGRSSASSRRATWR